MVLAVVFILAILFICDLLLVFYCKVKNGFRMFAFRIFAVLLAIISLILTGDIQIANGAVIDDIPKGQRQQFITNLRSCIPYSFEMSIGYENKINKQYRQYSKEQKYNYHGYQRIEIVGLYDDGTCHLEEGMSAGQMFPPADGGDGYGYRIPKNILSKITEDNVDNYLDKYIVYFSDVENNVNEFIPSILSKEEKNEIKKHFKTDRENFYSWYWGYMDKLDKKYNEMGNRFGIYIPSWLTNNEKDEIKKHFESDKENFYSWYWAYLNKLDKKD